MTMGFSSRNHISLLEFLLLFSCISLNLNPSVADDSISPGRSLSGDQTIVSRDGKFELGFFSPGNSHNYYVGIWFKKLTERTFIWVANRERPESGISSSELKISGDGNLVLLNPSKIPVWSSNSTLLTSNSTVAVLLDTGNLVLKGGLESSVIIWQSFDHPTDTWMPEGWLGLNKITGETYYLTSWRNLEDPAPGPFSYIIDKGKSNEYFLVWNGSEKYWSTGVWNGHFPSIPEVEASPKFRFSFVETEQKKYYTYTVLDDSIIARATLDVNGQMKLWVWHNKFRKWILVWTRPTSECSVHSPCGANGVCDEKSLLSCKCLQGFEPVSMRNWDLNDRSGGCHRLTPLQCSNNTNGNKKDEFFMMPNMRLPQNSVSLVVGIKEDCESTCLDNCSCTAYAYGTGCSIWIGELLNLQQLYDGDNNAQTLYLRLATSERPSPSRTRLIVYIIAAVVGGITFFSIALGIAWRHRRRSEITVDGSLLLFTYNGLKPITGNFSEKVGGGGFGSVYKGTLPDSTIVAVKQLEGVQQGHKQFRTEVTTLGTIQHVNLIRLRGFCAEGARRLLVYDFMPNGSLDSHLFSKTSKTLNWGNRYLIILGIARGLAYLHEKCRECIIHCDIKPENILLDAEFCPKVADFGLAKLLGRDFSRVLTTMRGTVGYLAPEWISGLAITPKADVYSFGMMLFEVVSGRRNVDRSKENHSVVFFPVRAAIQVNKGEVLELLDPKLDGTADMEELKRVCRIACWCIQDCETRRLSMGQVVQILEGSLEVNTPPIPRALQHLTEDHDTSINGLSSSQFSC